MEAEMKWHTWTMAVSGVVAVLLGVGGALGAGGENGSDRQPVEVLLENPYGEVLFSHEAHGDFACSKCHPPFDFAYDHNRGYSLRAHRDCIGCHEKQGVGGECSSCHDKTVRPERAFDAKEARSKSKKRQKILDFFYARRSIRKFKEKEVPRELVEDLLRAAMSAPSAGNWQPWRFLVITQHETRVALAATSPFAKYAADSPVVIVVFGKADNRWSPYDCALASGNLLLAAARFGLGGTYCGLDPERDEVARKLLDIPDDYFIHALIPLGYPDEDKKAHTKYNPDLIHWEKYDSAKRETVVTH